MFAILGRGVFFLFLLAFGFALGAALGGTMVWLLWNALVPALLGGPLITFWQAVALNLVIAFVVSWVQRAVRK